MIFPKTIAGKITRGEITRAIRPATRIKPSDRRCIKATQRGVIQCHIEITSVHETTAGQVTFKTARACGYRTTDDLKTAWVAQFDTPFMLTLLDMDDEQAHEAAVARFHRRHAATPAHILTFRIAVDTPRFLAHPGPNQGDYTKQRHRAIDDLEVIDEQTATRYTKKAADQAASFKRDLETERQIRRNTRRNTLFNRAA